MSRRSRLEPDRGVGQTKVLATSVAVLLAAAVIALLFVTFGRDKSTAAKDDRRSATGRIVTTTAAPTPTIATPTTAAAPTTPAPTPSSSVAAVATSRPPAPQKPITYVVKRGDNLTVIAEWFHEHGYGALYERNRAVIGDNPNLIYPGQRITISGGSMKVG